MSRPKYPIKKYVDIFSPTQNITGDGIEMTIKEMLRQLRKKERLTIDRVVVGYLDDEIVKFLEESEVAINTKEIYLTHKGLSHLARTSKKKRGAGLSDEDIADIPNILSKPYLLFFDSKKEKLNLIFCGQKECSKLIKIVVDTQGVTNRKEKITLIKTAGYIEKYNIKENKEYVQIL